MRDDILRLYNVVHVLVGTPGRILDLAEKGVAILKDCKIIIMDEADKVLFLFCVFLALIFGQSSCRTTLSRCARS